MKLSNIFKKSTKTVAKANVETLAKNQLEKVIGGGGPDEPVDSDPSGKVRHGGIIRGNVEVTKM